MLLGGDHPLAPPLIAELERKGYIIITSVQTAEHGHDLERRSHGYVRAIELDPSDVSACLVPLNASNMPISLMSNY